jgi:hypothetical protein
MTTDAHSKNKQRQRMVIFTFGLLMLLYAASKNPNLPSEWTGIHKVESGIQIPKSSSECGSD